jgi:hypothetical protein
MNSVIANIFLIPMGLGSSMILAMTSSSDIKNYHKQTTALLFIGFTYFVVDFILMATKYKSKSKIFFLHHVLGIISIPVVYFGNYHLIKYLLSYMTFELTTPLLNMAISNRQRNVVGFRKNMTDTLFIMSYTLIRIIFGSYLMYKSVPEVYKMNFPLNLLALMPVTIQSMNYWWYYKIFSMILKKK